MINKQAVDKMAEMLALIKKYGRRGDVEVETEASNEYRRRAWVITKMLSKLAEHAAESDFYFLRSSSAHATDKERERFYRSARQEDREFMKVLCEFDERATKFSQEPAGSNEKTETQLVCELELLTAQVKSADAVLQRHQSAAEEKAVRRKIKDVPAFIARDASVADAIQGLKENKDKFAKATAAAAARGFSVKVTKLRTVVTRNESLITPPIKAVRKVDKLISTEIPKSAKKVKPRLKAVAEVVEKAKARASLAKKTA